jgi:protein-tyrosine phosphatase
LENGVLGLGLLRPDPRHHDIGRGKLIFVCSGNICRSPYAEAVARRYGMRAVSCGTRAEPGGAADITAVSEAAQRGVDMSSHRSTRWRDVELQADDIVIAMQLRHALAVLPRARAHLCPVLLFSSLLSEFAVIEDPYGKAGWQFRSVFNLIDAGITRIMQLRGLPTEGAAGQRR